jgi:hypothetical protein
MILREPADSVAFVIKIHRQSLEEGMEWCLLCPIRTFRHASTLNPQHSTTAENKPSSTYLYTLYACDQRCTISQTLFASIDSFAPSSFQSIAYEVDILGSDVRYRECLAGKTSELPSLINDLAIIGRQ